MSVFGSFSVQQKAVRLNMTSSNVRVVCVVGGLTVPGTVEVL